MIAPVEELLPLLVPGRKLRIVRKGEPWFTIERKPNRYTRHWEVFVREIYASLVLLDGTPIEVEDDFDVEDLL